MKLIYETVKYNLVKAYEDFLASYNSYAKFNPERIRTMKKNLASETEEQKRERIERIKSLRAEYDEISSEMDRNDNNPYYDNLKANAELNSLDNDIEKINWEEQLERGQNELNSLFNYVKRKYEVLQKRIDNYSTLNSSVLNALYEKEAILDAKAQDIAAEIYGPFESGEELTQRMLNDARKSAEDNFELYIGTSFDKQSKLIKLKPKFDADQTEIHDIIKDSRFKSEQVIKAQEMLLPNTTKKS